MPIRYTSFPVTTNAGGAATAYSPRPVSGELLAIRVQRGTLTSGTADVAITDDASGMALLTLTDITADGDYFPRAPAVPPGTPGTPITNSFVPIPVTGKVKVVVAQGGATTTGTIHLWWRD